MSVIAECDSSTALRLFASIFQREADEPLLREIKLRRDELNGVLDGDPLAGLEMNRPEEAVGELAVEFCRLFVGPRGHMPPVESVALGEGRFWGDSTVATLAFYQSSGVAVPDDLRLLPDHVSVELDFIAMLEAGGRREEAKAFAQEHLLHWLPAVIRHIDKRARLAFYRVWSKGLQGLLNQLYCRAASGPSDVARHRGTRTEEAASGISGDH